MTSAQDYAERIAVEQERPPFHGGWTISEMREAIGGPAQMIEWATKLLVQDGRTTVLLHQSGRPVYVRV